MNKKIIVIEGYLASGKSTFAVQLSKTLTIPYLIKDTFKIALCSSLSIADRYESSRFSAVTFDAMMYVTERLMETGYPFITRITAWSFWRGRVRGRVWYAFAI